MMLAEEGERMKMETGGMKKRVSRKGSNDKKRSKEQKK